MKNLVTEILEFRSLRVTKKTTQEALDPGRYVRTIRPSLRIGTNHVSEWFVGLRLERYDDRPIARSPQEKHVVVAVLPTEVVEHRHLLWPSALKDKVSRQIVRA